MHPELISLILFMFVTSCSPGPNNILASYSGFNFGVIKTIPHMMGVVFGFTFLVSVMNFGLINVFQKYPITQEILKYTGSAFLIYMAYKISFSKSNTDQSTKNPVKFHETFFFQFINPKGVIIAMILVSTFIDSQNYYLRDSLIVIIISFFMAVFSVSSWCILGKYLRKFATSENFIKKFNYIMSFLLIVCVIMFYV